MASEDSEKKDKVKLSHLGMFLAEQSNDDSDSVSDDLDEIEVSELKDWLRNKLKQVEAGY